MSAVLRLLPIGDSEERFVPFEELAELAPVFYNQLFQHASPGLGDREAIQQRGEDLSFSVAWKDHGEILVAKRSISLSVNDPRIRAGELPFPRAYSMLQAKRAYGDRGLSLLRTAACAAICDELDLNRAEDYEVLPKLFKAMHKAMVAGTDAMMRSKLEELRSVPLRDHVLMNFCESVIEEGRHDWREVVARVLSQMESLNYIDKLRCKMIGRLCLEQNGKWLVDVRNELSAIKDPKLYREALAKVIRISDSIDDLLAGLAVDDEQKIDLDRKKANIIAVLAHDRKEGWHAKVHRLLLTIETKESLDDAHYAAVEGMCAETFENGAGQPIEYAKRIFDAQKKHQAFNLLLPIYADGIASSQKKTQLFLFFYEQCAHCFDPNDPQGSDEVRLQFIQVVAKLIIERRNAEHLPLIGRVCQEMNSSLMRDKATYAVVRAKCHCTGHVDWYDQAMYRVGPVQNREIKNACYNEISQGVCDSPFHLDSYEKALSSANAIKEDPRSHDDALLNVVMWITAMRNKKTTDELSVSMWKNPQGIDPYDKATETAKLIKDGHIRENAWVAIAMRCIDTKGVRWSHRAKEVILRLDKASPNLQLLADQLASALEAVKPKGWETKLRNARRLSREAADAAERAQPHQRSVTSADIEALQDLNKFLGEYSGTSEVD